MRIFDEYPQLEKKLRISERDAFGRNENPSYEDYEEFLESTCFPRSQDKMKLMLEELDLPF